MVLIFFNNSRLAKSLFSTAEVRPPPTSDASRMKPPEQSECAAALSQIRILVDLVPGLPKVKAGRVLLQQVILNLAAG
jgi:hypothetical protein